MKSYKSQIIKVKNVLILSAMLILINFIECYGQEHEELLIKTCSLIDSSKYKIYRQSFPISTEIENGEALESIFFPLILNGNLESKNLSDFIGSPIDYINLTNQILNQKSYRLPNECGLNVVRKFPSDSKRFYTIMVSNPIILSGRKRTLGFILIRSNSNNALLAPLKGILYEWNGSIWKEIIRKELEFHD
ncbi:hypothetical protein DFQ04_1983 [Algoriphagus boseongensis]|uniref:Uncharacterized protein n=1 Tax=Algoriphagus boseongensis TaxID=1442587 RepID=A0A4R6T4C4_9BACT|nr:hypothetical protein [Algoriphagus boseongensis]TDQ17331.1 hypothetical protein DFQ04_1983 [Algoriphagus boseongensis]